jgi:hypothetical protein
MYPSFIYVGVPLQDVLQIGKMKTNLHNRLLVFSALGFYLKYLKPKPNQTTGTTALTGASCH